MTRLSHRPILINGSGNAAIVTALALAQAGLRPHIAAPDSPPRAEVEAETMAPDTTWQSVLALSPAAKTMLESLAVWAHLDTPGTPVCDMSVYGSAADWQAGDGLSFAAATKTSDTPDKNAPVEVLAHIVSLADLSASLRTALDKAMAAETILPLSARVTGFDNATGRANLADDTALDAALMIECARGHAPWHNDAAELTHDYDMAALVGTVTGDRPHAHQAIQLFLPDGPLALLPLPDAHSRALIWSLPRAKARALAAIERHFLVGKLTQAVGPILGKITDSGPLAVQDLSLKLADIYVDGHLCRLGEAAHIVHPLAGQGFNLTLRDAALLADCLFDARRLGLAADGPHVLHDFAVKRRADAAITAAVTHGLAQIFSGPARAFGGPLGRLGLKLTGRLAQQNEALRRAFQAQADGQGAGEAPRLWRGDKFK